MKKYSIEIKWAVFFVIMTLVWMLLEKRFGLHGPHIDKHSLYTNFIAIPAIAVYVFALLDKRKNFYSGVMTYKQGFIAGLVITVIIAVFCPLTQYIISTFITPEYFPNAIDYAARETEMTRTEAEAYFNLKNYIIQAFIGTLVMGLITSAAVAIFTKRKPKALVSSGRTDTL